MQHLSVTVTVKKIDKWNIPTVLQCLKCWKLFQAWEHVFMSALFSLHHKSKANKTLKNVSTLKNIVIIYYMLTIITCYHKKKLYLFPWN